LKKFVLPLALLCLAFSSFAQDFRATTWLMTKTQVIDTEKTRVISEESFAGQQQLVFQSLVYGFSATITYLLVDDRLLSASYTFRKDADRSAFDAVSKDLIGKYGPATLQKGTLLGWRLDKTEIALTHLADGTTQAGFWEKSYFARINGLAAGPQS